MSDNNLSILQRFINGKECHYEELIMLREWLEDSKTNQEIEAWLEAIWDKNLESESSSTFEQIVMAIDVNIGQEKSSALKRYKAFFRKVAVILLIPLLGLSSYLLFDNLLSGNRLISTMVPSGQKSELLLPDGTHIWINSETTIKYPADFSRKREVFLNGEAYFEVAKQNHKSFTVHIGKMDIKVLGTIFNVKAYPESRFIETALLEGHVQVVDRKFDNPDKDLYPGKLLIYSKDSGSSILKEFDKEHVFGWKNNRLIFRDDTFDNLVKKIERWYNVEVIYDADNLKDQRLTVELLEGESLEQLMEIIRLTVPIEYKMDKNKVIISYSKKKSGS